MRTQLTADQRARLESARDSWQAARALERAAADALQAEMLRIVEAGGSQVALAENLGLTRGRVSQIISKAQQR